MTATGSHSHTTDGFECPRPAPGSVTDDASGPVRTALDAAVPDRRVAGVDPVDDSDHPGNEVVRVRFEGDDPVYVKTATAEDGPERVARETALLRYLDAHAGVAVPSVLAADADAAPPYLVTAPLPGERLVDRLPPNVDAAALADPLRRLGRALAGIHAARLDRAAWVLGGDADGLDLDADPWPTVLRERVAESHPVPDRFADVPGRVAALIEERADTLRLAAAADGDGDGDGRVPPPTVVHGDCHLQNVHDDPLGVLDLESGTAGDPVYDLAYTEDLAVDGRPDLTAAERDDARAALRAGYRAGADALDLPVAASGLPPGYEHRRACYRPVTFLVTVATFDRWAPDAPEPVADLADWVREEFDRRVAAAPDVD